MPYSMDIWDTIITPIFFFFFIIIAFLYTKRNQKNMLVKKYFFSALLLRITASLVFGLIYQFYYKGGDTFNYWRDVILLYTDALSIDPLAYIQILWHKAGTFDPNLSVYKSNLWFKDDSPSFFVVKVASFISLFTFHTYSSTSLFFALLGFFGSWKLFITLQKQYPHLTSKLAFSTLFIPSVIFWGSGIMKDTLCITALCYLYSSFYDLITYRESVIKNSIIILLSGYTLYSVKLYILVCFIPAIVIWLFFKYNNSIKSKMMRNFLRPLVLIFSVTIGVIGSAYISAESDYSLKKLEETSRVTATYIKLTSIEQGGSVYDLGEIDYTPLGLLKIFPQGVNVTLFRPYIWESTKVVILISAIESSFFMWLTFRVIFSNGIFLLAKKINEDAFVYSALIFTIIFAFAIGISTNNFGTLVRYKIPVMPFFLTCLFILEKQKIKNE